jgi:hypothetical protein
MHTSVEKHALHIAKSCGTLAHASAAAFFGSSAERLMRTRHVYAVLHHSAVSPRGEVKVLYNRLQPPHWFHHPKHCKDHC